MRKRRRKKWVTTYGHSVWAQWTPVRRGDPIEKWARAFWRNIDKDSLRADRFDNGCHDRWFGEVRL